MFSGEAGRQDWVWEQFLVVSAGDVRRLYRGAVKWTVHVVTDVLIQRCQAITKNRWRVEIWWIPPDCVWALPMDWNAGARQNRDVTWRQVRRGHFHWTAFFLKAEHNVNNVSEGHLQPPSSRHANLSCVCVSLAQPFQHACVHPDTLTSRESVSVVVDPRGQTGEVLFTVWEVWTTRCRELKCPELTFSLERHLQAIGVVREKWCKWT